MKLNASVSVTLGHGNIVSITETNRLVVHHNQGPNAIATLDLGVASQQNIQTVIDCLDRLKSFAT